MNISLLSAEMQHNDINTAKTVDFEARTDLFITDVQTPDIMRGIRNLLKKYAGF